MSGISKRVSGSWVSGNYGIMKTATDTITTLPADLYADGNNATVGISGNMEQNGTPTPDNPIQPQGTGDKTGNLFDGQLQQGFYAYMTGNYTLADTYVCTHLIPCTENTTYTFRCINTGGGSKNYGYVFFDSAQNRIDSDYINVLTEGDVVTHAATTPQNTAFLAIDVAYGRRQASVIRPSDITDFMLNTGSTALPYEPYGYKIPISSANTTTPVYLGEVQTTRKIKKYVFTGSETWNVDSENFYCFVPETSGDGVPYSSVICSHCSGSMINNTGKAVFVKKSEFPNITTGAELKQYCLEQYTASTPLTVWYVLSSATTGIVNEPIRKIGNYADTVSGITIPTIAGANSFDVLTTLKPSEVTVNYHGWHPVQSVHEYDSNYTIATMQALTIAQLQTHTISGLQGGEWS